MNTIAPTFPGDYAAYADQAPQCGTYQARHERQRRGTPAGRVRKPNRRRGVLLERAARAVSVVSVAFTVGAVLASLAMTGNVL